MRLPALNPRAILIILLVVMAAAFRVWASQPNWLHYDENYYLNIAQNYADRGDLTPYMWRLGDTNIIAGSGSGYGVVLLSIWLNWVKGSLFLGRLFMAAVGLLSAGVVYLIGREWWGSQAAGIAALAFGLASTSPFYNMTVRMDALGILAYCLVLLLYLRALRPGANLWLSFGVGLTGVVTLEFHVMGMLYLFALGCTYLFSYLKTICQTKRIPLRHPALYFAAGAALAGAVYAWVHVMPDPKAYFFISQSCYECDEGILITEMKRLLRLIIYRPVELLLLFAVIFVATRRVRRLKLEPYSRYLVLVGGWIAAQAVVGPPPYDHYASHFWPLLALGVGGVVWMPNNPQGEYRRTNIVLISGMVMLAANLTLFLIGQPPYLLGYLPEETSSIQYILQNVPQDSVVMGRVPSFYLLRNYRNYLTYRDGDVYGVKLRGETMSDFWAREQPEVVLVEEPDVRKDPELLEYLQSRNFSQLQPDLWVAESLHSAQP